MDNRAKQYTKQEATFIVKAGSIRGEWSIHLLGQNWLVLLLLFSVLLTPDIGGKTLENTVHE